ncbi:MAG: hypothetical protein ACC645_01715 [Pirellulales bacterium]
MNGQRFLQTAMLGIVGTIVLGVAGAQAAQLPGGFFTDLRPVDNVNDSGSWDLVPRIASDGLELFFARGGGGSGPGDLWVARRPSTDVPFREPERLDAPINTNDGEFLGSLSSDGRTLYFSSARAGGAGSWDVWTATRQTTLSDFADSSSPDQFDSWLATHLDDLAFGNPQPLTEVNTAEDDGTAFISSDNLTLYFHRDGSSTLNGDLWKATRASPDQPFGPPVEMTQLNSVADDYGPTLSSDEKTLFFSDWTSNPKRPGGQGGIDIWFATRPSADVPFGEPRNLINPGWAINTPAADGNLTVAADWPNDGATAYFATTRRSETDLWQATWRTVGHPEDISISPAIVTALDNDGSFDGVGDATNNKGTAPRASLGELDAEETDLMSRLVIAFDLSDVSPTVKGATLRLYVEGIEGTPAGPISVYHDPTYSSRLPVASGYEDPGFVDTLADLAAPSAASDADQVGACYEVDVTDQVLLDYASDPFGAFSAFRLQVDGATFTEDNLSHRYRLTMLGGDHPPELVLTFIPEPTGLVLAILGLFSLTRLRIRRLTN